MLHVLEVMLRLLPELCRVYVLGAVDVNKGSETVMQEGRPLPTLLLLDGDTRA
jgi:hypothetical protein